MVIASVNETKISTQKMQHELVHYLILQVKSNEFSPKIKRSCVLMLVWPGLGPASPIYVFVLNITIGNNCFAMRDDNIIIS